MSRIAIATDSNSGITQAQGKELGIYVLPMPFYINDELFLEDITLSQEQFYQRLAEDADVKTTQPAPGDVIELWEKILKDYDQIVYIPMSSGLSSSWETAEMLSQDYEGKVFVVNNQRISVTQRQSVLDAKALAEAGMGAAEIKALLEQTKFESDIYITVDTLKSVSYTHLSTPSTVATAASPAAAAYFRSTSAPTNTKSMTSAHTHSLPNLAVSRSATGSRHRRRPGPMPSTASRPEKGTGITSSRATSRKATERRSTTFTESRMWSFSKNFASRKPTTRPKTAPRTMDTGTPARADTEKEPPCAMEVKEVKRTMTNTSSTEAPARIIWGIPFFVP